MVIVLKGKTILQGDTADVTVDILTFLESINDLKMEDPKAYKSIKYAMKYLIEEDTSALNVIQDFAVNMKAMLS